MTNSSMQTVKKISLPKRLAIKQKLRGHLELVAAYANVSYNTVCNNLKNFIQTGEWTNPKVLSAINRVIDEINQPSADEISLTQKMIDDEE